LTDWVDAGLPNALALLQLCSELFIVSGLSCNFLKDWLSCRQLRPAGEEENNMVEVVINVPRLLRPPSRPTKTRSGQARRALQPLQPATKRATSEPRVLLPYEPLKNTCCNAAVKKILKNISQHLLGKTSCFQISEARFTCRCSFLSCH
jgi:hypothetical protein